MQPQNPNYLHYHYPQIHPPNPIPNPNPNPNPLPLPTPSLYQSRYEQPSYAYSYRQPASAVYPDPVAPRVYPGTTSVAYPEAVPHSAYYSDPNWGLYARNPYATGGTILQTGTEQPVPAVPSYSAWTNPTTPQAPPLRDTWKRAPKKTKVVQSAWCEICKIECNTRDMLEIHKVGKKHAKSLEKLTLTAVPVPLPVVVDKPAIGPPENPNKNNKIRANKRAAALEDIETKKKKILDGGAAADALRTCEVCNVVCNSDIVFKHHLVGAKHAAMMKQYVAS